ncbi:MAG: SAM-dependent methyltransferase [Lachnospiraceae bacterium]|nr:SAM-dependent methyltransferase [Lachnospiraceae bacterium]
MKELQQYIELMIKADVQKIIISNPVSKTETYKKIVVENKGKTYQISCYTDKQVFHENVTWEDLVNRCAELTENHFKQINGMSASEEHIILISKKGACNYKVKKCATDSVKLQPKAEEHNRKKNYILKEGMKIEPLVDMGVFTKDGRVVNSMYDKYKQINRFIEIIDDEISGLQAKELNVIDFGCGKSYLTFVVYYYLTEVMNIKVNMIGLDLKKDVIEKCNLAAEKYGYDNLKFCLGDINGFNAPFDVDMVITLHACDTATDYALYNAIKWNAGMIFSVPCCQHELNKQVKPENLQIMSRYGIIKERFAALATDAIRGNILEYCGYKTQLLEFIDFDHTPKNILIRAVRRKMTPKSVKDNALKEINAIIDEFSFSPTLYNLLGLGDENSEADNPK